MKKYYTISEANQTISQLRPKIIKLMELNEAIDLLDSIEIKYADDYDTIKKDIQLNKKFHMYSVKFCNEIENLLEKGILIKDIAEGVLSFYSKMGRKEIMLCWKITESKISEWYEVGSDYESRKPIEELKARKKTN